MSELTKLLLTDADKVYSFVKENSKHNSKGQPVITKDDEWRNEKEWDYLYDELVLQKRLVEG